MLVWTIYISFLGAVIAWLVGGSRPALARLVALGTSLSSLSLAIIASCGLDPGVITTFQKIPWVPSLGITYFLAADGISATLVILTGIASTAGVLFSWNIDKRVNEFFALYLALIGAVFGVFLSFDLFLFFVFYEMAIIPKYFLIAIWGSTRRDYGAMKLALYSFAGSGLALIGILAVYVLSPARSFDLIAILQDGAISGQAWLFPLTFIGFAILAGLWPFHTWAPTGHVAAPTGASMLLAGVVMKLGAYGALRVSMTLFPEGLRMWQGTFAILGLIGIVYGAAVALTQNDLKFVIGYSSVSHMGFVVLGLMSATSMGVSGAVLQMFSHGVIAGLLFAVVGRMIYERAHTRDLSALEAMELGRKLPFAAITFFLASLASMGFPGFSGFIAEVSILLGVWKRFPILAVIAGVGILVTVGFTLRALQRSFYFAHPAPVGNAEPLTPITFPEKAGAILLLGTTILVGIYPKLLFDLIYPAVENPLFKFSFSG